MNLGEHYQQYRKYLSQCAEQELTTVDTLDANHYTKKFLENQKARLDDNNYVRLRKEILGFGPLESLLKDKDISEILVNSYSEVFYEKNGIVQRHHDSFSSSESYADAINRICHDTGIQFNNEYPHCDGMWLGFRVHLIAAPIAVGEPKLSLRRQSRKTWGLQALQDNSWCTPEQAELLKSLVNDKQNVLVIGATNTGKTTCINACLQWIDKNERVVFIEDTDELEPPNPISVKLITRMAVDSSLRTYNQEALLHQALRMRPDRLVVGEVRGREAKDYLMALATGHLGSWCSLHASHPIQALHRLELLVQMAQPEWTSHSVRSLIHLGIHCIITLENTSGHRRLSSLHRITSLESTGFCLEEIDYL